MYVWKKWVSLHERFSGILVHYQLFMGSKMNKFSFSLSMPKFLYVGKKMLWYCNFDIRWWKKVVTKWSILWNFDGYFFVFVVFLWACAWAVQVLIYFSLSNLQKNWFLQKVLRQTFFFIDFLQNFSVPLWN